MINYTTKTKEKKMKDKTKAKKTDGEKKPRKKSDAWGARMAERLEKPLKGLRVTRDKVIDATPPGHWHALSAAINQLETMAEHLRKLPEDFAPRRKNGKVKLDIGSIVRIKDEHAALYKGAGGAELFEGGVVAQAADFDPKYWLVTCTDGIKRVARKKHTEAAKA